MWYSFSAELPLRYNKYDINSGDKASSYIMGLMDELKWSINQQIKAPLPDGGELDKEETVDFTITCDVSSEISELPEEYFKLSVLNLVETSQERALAVIKPEAYKACRALSFLLAEHNANKQSFQPRVEPAYDEISWNKSTYKPYEDEYKRQKPDSYTDENGNLVIRAEAGIAMSVQTFWTIYGKLNTAGFDKLRACSDENLEFLLNEYYYALGEENVKSKFFHLFSIIEFAEKEYVSLSGAKRLFDEDDIKKLKKHMEEYDGGLSKTQKERMTDIVTQGLTAATDIGRAWKLTAILHSMGIIEIQNCAVPFTVDKKLLGQIIDLRNTFFHGSDTKDKGRLTVEKAVVMLMEIDKRVIDYRLNEGSR